MSEIFIFISTLESTGFKMSVAEGPNPEDRLKRLDQAWILEIVIQTC